MTTNENGRAPFGATADATDTVQGATVTSWEDSRLAALREADTNATDGYVVVEIIGDV